MDFTSGDLKLISHAGLLCPYARKRERRTGRRLWKGVDEVLEQIQPGVLENI